MTVYKTPDAGLIGQGLSSTLNMQTVRPLNFGSRVFAVNCRISNNSLGAAANAKATGNRFSASYIDQFAGRTVAVGLGFAHQETPIQEDQVGLYEPGKRVHGGNVSRPGLANGTWVSGGIKALRRTGYTKRDGLMATVKVRPSKQWTSTLDFSRPRPGVTTRSRLWAGTTPTNWAKFPCCRQLRRPNQAVPARHDLRLGLRQDAECGRRTLLQRGLSPLHQ